MIILLIREEFVNDLEKICACSIILVTSEDVQLHRFWPLQCLIILMPCLYVQYVIFLLSNVTTKIKNAEYDFIPVSVKNIELKKIPFMQ